MDVDTFIERAAIMEFDGGLSRFDAETAAARAQGVERWEAMNAVRGIGEARDNRASNERDAADDMPAMQPASEEAERPVPVGDVQGGRSCVELLALRMEGGCQ